MNDRFITHLNVGAVLIGLAIPWILAGGGGPSAAQDDTSLGAMTLDATAIDATTRHAASVPTTALGDSVPLLDGLGDLHRPISTSDARAQAYFDQGLRLYYAFNHAEARRAFREAQRRDPECAMCFWGEALAWGPNINLPMDSAGAAAALEAVERAAALVGPDDDPRERALVTALSTRFEEGGYGDRTDLDRAYWQAMDRLADRYPDDDDVSVLAAEARMTVSPWDYWTGDDRPREGMDRALELLRTVEERSPEHPGACHFYIHAVEKAHPDRAVPCAERLAELMPSAGHVVHMPGHIYIRVGRYREAMETNRHAVHADESYIRDHQPDSPIYTTGYYPHNYDFLAFAALMLGEEEEAVAAADRTADLIDPAAFGAPGMDFLEHWSTRPLQIRVRFQRWDEILATPRPPTERPHALALWHYARGRALAATGRVSEAESSLTALREILASGDLDGMRMEFNASTDIVGIAESVLAGRIAEARGDLDRAVGHLREGVRREDALLYGEPPEWSVPVRQELGQVLIAAGDREAAAQVFRKDLDRFPANHWSLEGLAEAEMR